MVYCSIEEAWGDDFQSAERDYQSADSSPLGKTLATN